MTISAFSWAFLLSDYSFLIVSLLFAAAIFGILFKVFRDKEQQICTVKTTVLAISVSVVVSLLFLSVLGYVVDIIWYPDNGYVTFWGILTVICPIILAVLMFFYIRLRFRHRSAKGVLVDLLVAIFAYTPSLWFIFFISGLF